MYGILPAVVIAVVVMSIALLFYTTFKKRDDNDEGRKKIKSKDRSTVLKEAGKKLSQNPKDAEALLALADLSFREEAWEKAMKSYGLLMELSATNPDIDEFEVTLRYALSALKLRILEEAYKGMVIAKTLKPEGFEVNHHLGYLEYQRQNYEKAVQLLRLALERQPEHLETLRFLGHSLFRTHRFRDAIATLRKVVEHEPNDKESLFAMAESYYELGHNEQAIKIFTHLRPDPQLGPSAALFAGTIHLNQRQHQRAVMDLEIGLRHPNIKPDILLELKYRLAAAYTKQQEIGRALGLLTDIQNAAPGYRDVAEQIGKFQELNSNRNLQTYLLAPTSEFITLCRRICGSYFPRSKVKIVDISVQKNEFADVLAQIETAKWEDLVLFRFIRTNGQVGELLLRDFHARIKDTKAGRGFCMSAGTFTDGAKAFVEARLIDLLDKDQLVALLHHLEPSAIS